MSLEQFSAFPINSKIKKKIKINKAFQFKMLTNTPIYQKFNFTNEKFWTCIKMLHVLLENFILLYKHKDFKQIPKTRFIKNS